MNPEISWSIMHPTALNIDYMKRIIAESKHYKFDSFELCGPCHGLNSGLDAVLDYSPYPTANANVNKTDLFQDRERINTIVDLAHSVNKTILYWHREVIVPDGLLNDDPLLLDKDGEFNLLGNSFEKMIRYKIDGFFRVVPEMDGIVLTLTEADYSVIHNSNMDKYPPAKVVEKIVRIFASELQRLEKRFVLRSFGSIAQDYRDILAGAELAAVDYPFEIETKITPFDFVPFLDRNPFLTKINNCTLSAECDSLGEFLGAGFLPAANVNNIVRYVKEAKAAQVERFAIRIDRAENSIFDTHEINLFAYHCAIENDSSVDEIFEKWAALRWKACSPEMIQLAKDSYNFVTKVNYIDKNVIFHKFPPNDDIAWLKLGGIFALFSNGKKLSQLSGIWSIMSHNCTPGRDSIIAEKAQAIAIAEKALHTLKSIKDRLSPNEYNIAYRLWNNAVFTAKALCIFCQSVCTYFDAMEQNIYSIDEEIEKFKDDFEKLESIAPNEALDIYIYPLKGMMLSLGNEFRMESLERQKQKNALDLIVCGSLSDEWRTGRYQHGSKTVIHNQRLGREIGNRVFPNGFIETILVVPPNKTATKLLIEGVVNVAKEFKVILNDKRVIAHFNNKGEYFFNITEVGQLKIKIEKSGVNYPIIHTMVLF